jgi:hypothetical protein
MEWQSRPHPGGPLDEASEGELRRLQQFLLYLGSALTAAAEAVNQIEEHDDQRQHPSACGQRTNVCGEARRRRTLARGRRGARLHGHEP